MFADICEAPVPRVEREGPDGEPARAPLADILVTLNDSGIGTTGAVRSGTSGRSRAGVAFAELVLAEVA
ncbi:hypothetical protein [Mesobacterium pallidum]|uniref:hypothetical protein n=1 Tax=Mesobacterium pallidum TaxID=2872037 RepID=UPI001EE2689B|nr:hypothetical protein [Mesobacterium pallidum]